MTTFITFRPRPTPDGIDAFAGFLAVAARLCGPPGLFKESTSLSLELFADDEAVRFFIVCPTKRLVGPLCQELVTWHPGAELHVGEDDPLPRQGASAVAELRLVGEAALPLAETTRGNEPLRSLFGSLSQLIPGEHALFQIVIRPHSRTAWAATVGAAEQSSTLPARLRGGAEEKRLLPGFAAAPRLLTLAPTKEQAQGRLRALLASLATCHGPANGLTPARPALDALGLRLAVHRRQTGLFSPSVPLSSRDLATLFHAPDIAPTALPKLALAPPGPLAAVPRQLPTSGLPLGTVAADRRPLFLPETSRSRHLLFLGPTGAGKSHALAACVLADLAARRGCSLLTPSPDVIERILRRAPANRLDDIILVRFTDPDWVFGLNPLQQAGAEPWRVASELVAIWERLYPQFWGPVVSDLFKHAALALCEQADANLLDLVELLESPAARQRLLPQIADPLVRRYWQRFDDLSLSGQETRTRSSLNKLRAPLIIPWLRRTLTQPNSLSIRDVLDQGKIVLWDLSNLADEGRLLGALVVSGYFQAALARAAISERQRVPHTLYADEWHVWPTSTWSKGLDLLRQFNVGLVLAGQRLDQISEELRGAVLANVGSALVWALRSHADAPTMAHWLATPGLEAEHLKQLGRFQAYARILIDGAPSPAIRVELPPLPPEVSDPEAQIDRIASSSYHRYYHRAAAADQALCRRLSDGESDPKSRPITRRPADRSASASR
jgi:hypothetical protein